MANISFLGANMALVKPKPVPLPDPKPTVDIDIKTVAPVKPIPAPGQTIKYPVPVRITIPKKVTKEEPKQVETNQVLKYAAMGLGAAVLLSSIKG